MNNLSDKPDSQKHHSDFYNLAPVGYCTLSKNKMILEANRTTHSWLGPAHNIINQPIIGFIHKADQKIFNNLVKQLDETGKTQTCEIRLCNEDQLLWAQLEATLSQDKDSIPVYLLVLSNINERKQAERTLQMKDQYYREIIEITQDGYWLLDTQGKVLDVNEAYCELTGFSKEELLQFRISNLDALEEPEEIAERIRRIIEKGPELFETRHRRKDGSVFDVEISTTYLDMNGGRFICFCRDISNRKLIEETLRKNEERYRLLFERSPLGYQSLDANGNFIEANQAWLNILGYQREDVIGNWFGNFLDPQMVGTFRERFPYFKEVGEITTQFQMVHKNGHNITVAFDGKIGLNELGEFKQTHCIIRDITKDEELINKLRQSEERYYAMFEKNQAIKLLIDPSDGAIMDANTAAVEFYGYTLDQLKAMKISDINTLPSEEVQKEMAFAASEQRPYFNFRHRLANGEFRDVEVYSSPIEISGRTLLNSIIHDITQRKKAELALQESERRFKEIIANSKVGYFFVDKDGLFQQVNQAWLQMHGYTVESEVIGQHFSITQADEDMEGAQKIVKKLLSGEIVSAGEFTRRYKDGSTGYHHFTANPVKIDGKVVGLEGFLFDTTKQKRIENELQLAYLKLEALWSISGLEETNLRTISDNILIPITRMTNSKYGFYGFLDSEETTLTIHSWNGEAMQDCSLVDKPQHFLIDECGAWTEAIRRREPFIMNRYADPHPSKKGLPDGHVPLTKILVVPHFSQGKITAVAAVANSLDDYTSEDVNQITTFLNSIHALVNQKRTEEALRMSEERYHLIDEASQDLIYSYDLQGCYMHANSSLCKLLGKEPDQIIGKTHEELGFPQEQCDEWVRLHQQVYDTNSTVITETVTPIQDGPPQYFEVVLNPIHDAAGTIAGIAGTTRDINARKAAEKKIKDQLTELRRWHDVTLGREDRILDLKREINQLLANANLPPRYASVEEDNNV
ncbi:MAG: PAS domain S-box protein [Anaerolineaceae bacterium]|nr:PAS domain S-box protein [Anaerolineaceae bacterium]